MGIYDGVFVLVYFVMFYVVRVLFFKDGWWEKSYVCVLVYFREFYVKFGFFDVKWVRYLDYVRNLRY